MTRSSDRLTPRIRRAIGRRFRDGAHGVRHCRACDQRVSPFTTCCPNCGQSDPAKAPVSAAVCMVLATAIVAAAGFLV